MLARQVGFSILAVMVAVSLLASLGLAIWRLELAEVLAAQQILLQQALGQAASSIANQIYADLNYTAATSLSRRAMEYAETSYGAHRHARNCRQGNLCSAREIAAYNLAQWKQGLSQFQTATVQSATVQSATVQPAVENIYALVCRDNSGVPPTPQAANCNGQGGLVVKIAWVVHAAPAEAAVKANYVMLAVPQR